MRQREIVRRLPGKLTERKEEMYKKADEHPNMNRLVMIQKSKLDPYKKRKLWRSVKSLSYLSA